MLLKMNSMPLVLCLVVLVASLQSGHGAVDFSPAMCCQCGDHSPFGLSEKPKIMPSPFRIEVGSDSYVPNIEVKVNLTSTSELAFRSFFLAAYPYPYVIGTKPVGQIKLLPNQDYQTKDDCITRDNALNQANSNAVISRDDKYKSNVRFVWSANEKYGHVEFRATFIVDSDVFWVSEKSRVLADASLTYHPQKQQISPINTDKCGDSKGCFREPEGCTEPNCMYILTWVDDSENIQFELGGLADGSNDRYVAFAISDDKYMGDDTVFTCAHNSARDKTEVFLSYNTIDPKTNNPIPKYKVASQDDVWANHDYQNVLVSEEGSYENGRLRCRFKIRRDLDEDYPELKPLRGAPNHLLFAHGFANKGSPQRHGLSVEELPLASAQRVDFGRMSNYYGRSRYPLAKAHGCLMILAWVFFASIGLLLTKYYKPMWPNSRIFEHKYWFFGHFNCMATMFIIVIIAIILIFVEAGGYSEAPELPQKAHPILGIIILVCIIINPILALIRPSEDNKCRPVFNWFHWAFGTIANVLAIPTIFIGMDFGKVMVPWWATWILVIWVIFHIIVELSLEIHQCCTYKKNKERRRKWEQTKREYPKQHHPEPDPVGHRFKRFMLFLHIGFTFIITLMMIIIIAVS
ncbi:ferric-chelate reductase 1 [Biomphalaria glabrata]|uniref:Ferric-chelate reductase 1 n=1 Tax=Biomphalaria glabrata TaxID=6526 RepID=A0A2C9M4U4_BIOGL|nr:putative ferric-chelate reductase 1 [Biomphalaria glabrata]XP_013077426.1 putative ferric-chelate reductase 1 [Biomphalaria glabrata]KAI8749733.1 putative ferric-chelate reductase 1 [Biomphalaria glabrata]KAI8787006.1 ferric-chelate reductase 1 [Biomphalaria glabrata]